MREDELIELLEQLDPARSEEPPAPGSARYTAMREQAMRTSTTPIQGSAPDSTTPTPQPRSPRRRRFVAAAAAAAVAVAVGVGVQRPGNEPSAEATIAAAAAELAQVTSLRADIRFDNDVFRTGRSTHAISGHDYDSVWEETTDDGAVETERIVTVDDVEYRTDSTGQTTAQPVDNTTDGGTFAESSAAVVTAALEDADVDEVGSEEIRGVDATHYRIEIPDVRESALAALDTGWFDLITADENPDGLDQDVTVDIWVADGLVRRFAISSPDYGYESMEFYDFNADITITPPPGPYAESPTG